MRICGASLKKNLEGGRLAREENSARGDGRLYAGKNSSPPGHHVGKATGKKKSKKERGPGTRVSQGCGTILDTQDSHENPVYSRKAGFSRRE